MATLEGMHRMIVNALWTAGISGKIIDGETIEMSDERSAFTITITQIR